MHVPSNYPEGMTGRGIVANRTVPFFSRYEAIMRCCCSTPGLLSAFQITTGGIAGEVLGFGFSAILASVVTKRPAPRQLARGTFAGSITPCLTRL